MTTPLHVQPLPFPGSPFAGESGNGFLLRMAERNGLRLHEFFTMLGRDPRRQLRPEDAPILARLFDCRTTDILPLFVRSGYGQYCVRHFDLYGRCISRFYLLDLKHPKVCSRCLAEFGYARAVWDLSLFVWCPIHQCSLIDHCPACSTGLRWLRPGVSICICGDELTRSVDSSPLPWSANAMAVLLSNAMNNGCSSRLKYPDGFEPALNILSALSLDGIMRLVWILGTESDTGVGIGYGRRRRSVSDAALILDAGLLKLQALLNNFSMSGGITTDIAPSALLLNALRRMAEDGVTERDRHFAQSCLEVVLGTVSRRKNRFHQDSKVQLSLSFVLEPE